MSDDPLGGTTPAPPAPAPAAPAPAYVTADQLAEHTQQITQQVGAAIREAMAGLTPAKPEGPGGTGGGTEGTDWPELFQNPKAAVDARVNEVTLPAVREFARSQSEMMLDSFQQEIDTEFGEGAWDKYFAPDLKPAVEQALKTNPLQAVSRSAVKNTLDTLRGRNFDKLQEARAAHRTSRTTADKAREDAIVERTKRELPGLTGGLMLTRDGEGQPTLDPEGKEFIQEFFRSTGTKLDEKELLASLNSGSKLSEWRAAQAALKSKSTK